jgi:hypothetical protein
MSKPTPLTVYRTVERGPNEVDGALEPRREIEGVTGWS